MWQLLNDLFKTAEFMPHGYCLQWKPALLWTLAVSDSLIAVAYFSIPFALFYFAKKRPDIPHRWLFLLFGFFIIACGITHLLDVFAIWQPNYWANAAAKALTATLSLVTAVMIWYIMPAALLAPSAQELEDARLALEKANTGLEYRVKERTRELASSNGRLQATLIEQTRLQQIIQHEKALLRGVIDSIPDMIFFKDTESTYLGCNKAFEEYFGAAEADIVGKTDFDFVDAETAKLFRQNDQQTLAANSANINTEWVTYPDGRKVCLETLKTPFRNHEQTVLGMIGVSRNITERKQAEIKLQLAASVFTHAREGIIITDAAGHIIEVNDTFTQISGYSRAEAIGQKPKILQSGRHGSEFYAEIWKSLEKHHYWCGEIWNRRKNGEIYAEMLTISAVRDDTGKTQNYVGLFSDITQMKDHQKQLEHNAHYDALTGLANRVLLADRLQHAMNQSQRRQRSLAVVYLDLDGFKSVNDSYGHEIGDELLIAVAQQMKDALRDGDTLARIGGDEFVAVLVDLEQTADCEPILLRLLSAAAEPVTVNNIALQVSASIGVTLYPQDAADAEQLMRHADQAMYTAKQAGKNRYHLFDVKQDSAVQSLHENLDELQHALELREFVLYYHPKVNMKTGAVIGAEALIRWQHHGRGLLLPADFLPVIENHPFSIELGKWVIESALTQMSDWYDAGLEFPVSVNVAARHLQHEDFLSYLSTQLASHPKVEPSNLELEVLETSALEDMATVTANMQACRNLGIRFALDDFGTGYSSLTYLRRLPADMLKIDQSFVRDMLDDPDDLAIVNGVIGLAHAFQRQVIAEGVESVAHGQKLLSLGCDLAQGYGIARPMPAEELQIWLVNWQNDKAWMAVMENVSG